MDIVQLVALIVGILGLVWHQQRIVERLRAEVRREIAELRAELRAEIAELRRDVGQVGQRVARIEGYFGIDMPSEAAVAAAGARSD